MEDMNAHLEKLLLEELTCPSCYNYMGPPIKQCQKGHSFCHGCYGKVTTCPKCRAPRSHTSRNYSLEAIHAQIQIPCKYQHLGCKFTDLGEHIKNHEKYCTFSTIQCPFAFYDSCIWNDSMTSLKNHLQKKHSKNFYQKDRQKFISQNFINIKNYHYIYAVLYVYENYFRLTWDINKETGMTRWAVYFMGSPNDATKFSYKLEFTKGSSSYTTNLNKVPLTFKTVCDAKSEKEGDKFGNHNLFYIHKSLLDKYCIENGDLHYRISIYALEEEENMSDIALLFKEKK